ncbi:hypothetical protein [Rhizobium sp. IBUN]|uniref:hypothetical protein n=1 Tax=Rhizobium sp. IBUN TaxID=1042326 RepID=UPI000472EC00|nr:hypothetical protein [Rhizobium sp. IBUN]
MRAFQDQSNQEPLQRRLEMVGRISSLTATAHKLIQQASGVEMEIMRLELALADDPADETLVSALRESEEQASAIRSEQIETNAAIEAAEAAVKDIDLLIAKAKGG